MSYLPCDSIEALTEMVPFTVETLSHVILEPEEPIYISGGSTELDYTAICDLSNEPVRAVYILSVEKDLAIRIMNGMDQDREAGELPDADLCDLVGELANQLVGSMKSILSEMGVTFPLSQPKLLCGRGEELGYAVERSRVVFRSEDGLALYFEGSHENVP